MCIKAQNQKAAVNNSKPLLTVEEQAERKAKKERPELFTPKDEYETTAEYNGRMEEKETLLNRITGEVEKEREDFKQAAIKASMKELKNLKIQKIGVYDADSGVFEITVQGQIGVIHIPREKAKAFKDNIKKAKVSAISQLDEDLEKNVVVNIEIIDPNDSTVYALEEFPDVSEMVLVQGGTFKMGGEDGDYGQTAEDAEKPKHDVTISDFYIGKYEVTQEEWEEIMGSNPSNFKLPNGPVENVSWDDAQEYINKINVKTGKHYRLPTEAEWEYVAIGGSLSGGYTFSGSNDADAVAWYESNSEGHTHEVGQKQANELGIFDMSGNVSEWCSDWYSESYYKESPTQNPQGPNTGNQRVLRGGSFSDSNSDYNYSSNVLRSSCRSVRYSGSKEGTIGFRLVRPVKD